MPYIIDAVQAYATMQDIMDVFREVFGEYEEMTII
jgi:methylmalonyl-CoA mutase N-terminal domain/subunit